MSNKELNNLDALKQTRIKTNKALFEQGVTPSDTFEFKGHDIHDPYVDESGRFAVEPIAHYGQAYLNWYQNPSS